MSLKVANIFFSQLKALNIERGIDLYLFIKRTCTY